jgi:hypothetical protein
LAVPYRQSKRLWLRYDRGSEKGPKLLSPILWPWPYAAFKLTAETFNILTREFDFVAHHSILTVNATLTTKFSFVDGRFAGRAMPVLRKVRGLEVHSPATGAAAV